MDCFDTGKCVPESFETLLLQQRQLIHGRRKVQMFPLGTLELPLPPNFGHFENVRGVFHYNANEISSDQIDDASSKGRENEFLNLGPFSKADIAKRAKKGERVTCIIEINLNGVEIRAAAATDKTIPRQRAYFEATKEPDTLILVGVLPDRVRSQLTKVK